jgi:signal transduction histidine kinase/CheY-like chemotaxis protein
MTDFDETARALHFAPVPLVVLDCNRTIKMLNRPAEQFLGLHSNIGTAVRLEQFIATSSHHALMVALNEASMSCVIASDSKSPVPTAIRLELQHHVQKQCQWVELSISAWFSRAPISSILCKQDTNDFEIQKPPVDNNHVVRLPQDYFFTISMNSSCAPNTNVGSDSVVSDINGSKLSLCPRHGKICGHGEVPTASQQGQKRLQRVIHSAAVSLWAVDRDGIITVAEGEQLEFMASDNSSSSDTNENKRMCSDRNGRKRFKIGQSIYQVWKMPNIKDKIERAMAGQKVTEKIDVDGSCFRMRALPLRGQVQKAPCPYQAADFAETNEEQIIGVVGTLVQISDREISQAPLEASMLNSTSFLAAEDVAREADQLKSEFLANMSHEFRTPIAAIIGLSEIILDNEEFISVGHREHIETMQRCAEGLLSMINDVLDFSNVEIGTLDLEEIPFSLEVLLSDVSRTLSFAIQKKGLVYKETVQLKYMSSLVGDSGKLRQILSKLLTNAIKFTSQGHISLDVSQMDQEEDDVIDSSILLRFDIRDSGCGIDEESISKLFQPFSQGDASTARRFGGAGLGLSFAKKIIGLMSGTLGLNSIKDQCTHAWFIVPFKRPFHLSQAGGPEEISSSCIDDSPSGKDWTEMKEDDTDSQLDSLPILLRNFPKKEIWILIAEDNSINARIAASNVTRLGYNCRVAEDGYKALEEVTRNKYDAVLMDCQMPECDGYEATRLIRSSSDIEVRTIPIIAFTANAIKGDREKALQSGMVDYLAKPAKRSAMDQVLAKWLFDTTARHMLKRFLP